MIYRLIILSGDRRGEQITLTQDPMIIGRAETCEIQLADPEIALSHAEIRHTSDGLHIRDLGSMNRLLINHREVHDAYPKHGDVIEVGHTRFLIQAYVQAEVQSKMDEADEEERSNRRKVWMVGGGFVLLLACMIILIPRCERHLIAPRPISKSLAPSKSPPAAARSNVTIRALTPPPQTPPPTPTPAVAPSPPKPISTPAPTHTQDEIVPSKLEPPSKKVEVAVPAREQTIAIPPAPKTNAINVLIAASEKELQEAEKILMGTKSANTTNKGPVADSNTNAPPTLPQSGIIKITGTEISKFPETEQFREMRLLTIQLTATEIQMKLNPEAVRVEVIFRNQDKNTGEIISTPAKGQPSLLAIQGKWLATDQKTVMASYVVTAPPPPPERSTQYYGFTIQVFYYGTLQNELSQPRVVIPDNTQNPPTP